MEEHDVLVGIDVGKQHQVCLMDSHGEIQQWTMTHRHDGFEDFQARLLDAADGDLSRVVVGLEGHNGLLLPMDRMMGEWDCTVVDVDARKLASFRTMFGADCKTDMEDARLIVHLLAQGDDLFQDGKRPYVTLDRTRPAMRKLRKISRHQNSLIEEKTRHIHRLKQTIREFCPELLDAGDVKNIRFIRVLNTYPNVRGMKRVTKQGLMDIYGIGTTTAERYLDGFSELTFDSSLLDVYQDLIENLTELILTLYEQIKTLDETLNELKETIRAVRILESLPGAGIKTASRLVGEIQSIDRFDSHNQLAAYLGVACVDNQSGTHDQAKPIFPFNSIGKGAMMELASNMIRFDKESRRYHEKKKSEGKKPLDAMRRVARQIVKIIYRLLDEERKYVPYHQVKQEQKTA